jgi:hypothetical protein
VDIEFLITTFNRQEPCQRLVDSLQGLGDIFVLNDGCDYEIKGCKQVFCRINGGKHGYWNTINTLFSFRTKHKYYIMLPDDFLMDKGQVDKAVETWERIKDGKKICLNLYADRIGLKCWTGFKPSSSFNCWHTQWVDMCFICGELFFTALGRINGPLKSNQSSGVGAYISKKLNREHYNLYQVKESLITIQPEHGISQIYGSNKDCTDRNYSRKARKFTIIT